ncbi:MAG: ABC transporter permease [Candidatus Merdivicinus sp.]|jgi:putative aldouronate transport system permease protein
MTKTIDSPAAEKSRSWLQQAFYYIKRDRMLWALVLPGLIFFIIFSYVPMGGVLIAFEDYRPAKGIFGSNWVGFRYFLDFFRSPYFGRLMRNTILISVYGLLWGFPIPILFALFLNELKNGPFKKLVQTVSYLPHFISVVVLVGMVQSFLNPYDGIVNTMIKALGGTPINFLSEPSWFRTIYVASGIWQDFGYNSIIYLSAISAVDPQLYEAARIDGAKRIQIMFRITLPCILPTAIIMLILNFGGIMNVGFEKVNLLYSPATYETADVISTYVYRRGVLDAQFSFSTAVGLFNSVINLTLMFLVNKISRRVSEVSLW